MLACGCLLLRFVFSLRNDCCKLLSAKEGKKARIPHLTFLQVKFTGKYSLLLRNNALIFLVLIFLWGIQWHKC